MTISINEAKRIAIEYVNSQKTTWTYEFFHVVEVKKDPENIAVNFRLLNPEGKPVDGATTVLVNKSSKLPRFF